MKKMDYIQIRVTEQEKKDYVELATKLGRSSISELIRDLLKIELYKVDAR